MPFAFRPEKPALVPHPILFEIIYIFAEQSVPGPGFLIFACMPLCFAFRTSLRSVELECPCSW